MLLGLTFTGTVDPAALATFALAIIAIVGRRSLKQTQDDIDLSRREVEEAHRPVSGPLPVSVLTGSWVGVSRT